MSFSEVDIMQSEQIEDLQNDVKELRDKLNLLVTDITHATNGLTKKLNDAIDDADDLNTIINTGYNVASGAGSSNVGILKRLDDLFQDLENHKHTPTAGSTPSAGTYIETHPPDHTSGSVLSGASTVVSNLSGTAQGSATRSQHTSVAQSVTATAPIYSTDQQQAIIVGDKNVVRARKLSRTLIKKTR